MSHPLSLFRQGVVRVVIATGMSHDFFFTFFSSFLSYIWGGLLGALALGINAPAKKTVFGGELPYLIALFFFLGICREFNWIPYPF